MTESMLDFKALIARVADGTALDAAESRRAFDIMMSGDATPAQMGGLLMALRTRGETVEEITGAATAMRALDRGRLPGRAGLSVKGSGRLSSPTEGAWPPQA